MIIPVISMVIPLYNEEEIFPLLIERLIKLIEEFGEKIEIILVNDGSTDSTPEKIRELAIRIPNFKGVLLSRNHGHQIALSAGLSKVSASEAIVVIDGDLQDPPELIHKLYEEYKNGYDVVYAVRKKRKEGFIKKIAYFIFYRFLNSISYIQLPLDSGDFCLMSRRVVDLLNSMPEQSRYIRGLRTWVGFKQKGLELSLIHI